MNFEQKFYLQRFKFQNCTHEHDSIHIQVNLLRCEHQKGDE